MSIILWDDYEQYVLVGAKSCRKGLLRSDNPYHFESAKGHAWDDGWLQYTRESRVNAKRKKLHIIFRQTAPAL